MVLLKRQKIVYRGLPGPVASFQQQAAGGEHPPDAAEASSSSNGGGPPKKKGADEVDDADKKEEVVSAKKEVYYLAETGEIFLDYECVSLPLRARVLLALSSLSSSAALQTFGPPADETISVIVLAWHRSYAGRMAFYKQKSTSRPAAVAACLPSDATGADPVSSVSIDLSRLPLRAPSHHSRVPTHCLPSSPASSINLQRRVVRRNPAPDSLPVRGHRPLES